MPYIIVIGSIALIIIFYGVLRSVQKRKTTSSSLAFLQTKNTWMFVFTGILLSLLLLCAAAIAALLLFVFLLFLVVIGMAYVLLSCAQKKDTSYCAKGMNTLAKQGGEFFMTLLALFIEFVLNFVGIA